MRGDRWGHHYAARHVTNRAIVPVLNEVTTSDSRKTHHFSMTCLLPTSDANALPFQERDEGVFIKHLHAKFAGLGEL